MSAREMPTHGEMINNISKEMSGIFTKKQLVDLIVNRYGQLRSINVQSLGIDIAGCCVNLKSHTSLPALPLILISLGRGKYRLYNPSNDKHLNRYLNQKLKRDTTNKSARANTQSPIRSITPKVVLYNYNDAKNILKRKGLLDEIYHIINNIEKVDHSHIQSLFAHKGWNVEHQIHPQVRWAWDAYKEKVPVSIELSLIDALHRDFLRLLLWNHENKVDVVVYITSTFKEPKFENVKRDLEIFRPIFDVPVLLIGLRA